VDLVRAAVQRGGESPLLSAGDACITVTASPGGETRITVRATESRQAALSPDAVLAVLDDALRRPGALVAELATLSPPDEAAAAAAINADWTRPAGLRPLHAAFEEVARTRPDLVAVESGDSASSYGEVNLQADRLASALRARGVGPEGLVGICLPRGTDMVVAVLATLKAGGAFVPLDPRAPVERRLMIARAAGLTAIVAHGDRVAEFASTGTPVVVPGDGEQAGQAQPPVTLDHLACMYFTSGSTGIPKGVALDHRCVAGRLSWLAFRYRLEPGDRVIHKAPLIFDVAIWEILLPLSAGATVVLADDGAEADVDHISSLLAAPRVRLCHFVPSMLNSFLSFESAGGQTDLDWVQLSGEGVPEALHQRFRKRFDCELHNMYGQTETSEVAAWEGHPDAPDDDRVWVPIGRQIGLYRLFLVDEALHLVPPGIPGELCVAGVGGLARGYQDQFALTAQRFVPNPWAVEPGERLYRTGDMAVAGADGTLTYLGRVDGQVKIRGSRVETGEVEAVLLRHPGVRESAVVARQDDNGVELAAFVSGDIDIRALAEHAEDWLPAYMLPAAYVRLDSLPRTPSGKIDRGRLPEPTAADRQVRSDGDEPASALEASLAETWSEVLGVDSVGPTDNFFQLGGNSLRSLRLINKVKASLLVDYSTREFFSGPTVRQMAARLAGKLQAHADETHGDGPAGPDADAAPASRHPFEEAVDPGIVPLLAHLPVLSFDDLDGARREDADFYRELRAARGPLKDVAVSDTEVAGVPVRLYTPRELGQPAPAVIWLHGGGFIAGSTSQNDSWCQQWATEHRCRVVSVDYRLAPESPYPAAIEDCCDVLRAVLADPATDPARVVLAGASAGGGLAAGTALRARDRGERLPGALALFYPMLDDRNADPETPASTYDKTWHDAMKRTAWRTYLAGTAGAGVPIYAAPGRASAAQLRGLPPTYVDVGALDIFRNEAVEFARKLMAAGVSCDLLAAGGAFHASEIVAPAAETSERIRAARAAFFARALAKPEHHAGQVAGRPQ
jgi:amino acid adenylation domain-containing protein